MEVTPDHALAAHVAAWHNRHPLARRITPAQVQAMGVVALPFTASTGKNKGALRCAFREDFIAPLGTRRVSRFTLRHGTSTRTGPDDWPQRDLAVKPGAASADAEMRYLRTAAIDLRNQRTRVLIGGGKRPKVLGQRLWSRPRLVGAASICGTALLVLAAALGRFSAPDQAGPQLAAAVASAPASAVTHAAAASKAASGAVIDAAQSASDTHTAHTALAASSAPSTAPAAPSPTHAAASTAEPASAAADGKQTAGADGSTRDIRPTLPTDLREAARRQARELRASKSGGTGNADAAAAASAPANSPTYAVATPVTRTRAAAQLRIVLMNAPTVAEPGQPHAEVMQTSNGWRTVVWPYPSRESAERTRESLAARGIPAEVIEF